MTKQDNYEDALFALLMEEVCAEQGQELLAECRELNELEEFDGEEERHRRGKETINRELGKLRRQKTARAFAKSFRALSVAAVLAIILSAAAYLSIPQFRDSVKGYFAEPVPTESIVESTSKPMAPGDIDYENYVEKEHSYEYTAEGIIETIVYENPETGDCFTVKVFTEYSTDPIYTLPTPFFDIPTMTEGNYIHGGYGSGYTYNGGMGHENYSGYDPNTGVIIWDYSSVISPTNPYGSYPQPGPTSALPNPYGNYPQPMIAGAGYGGRIGPGYP